MNQLDKLLKTPPRLLVSTARQVDRLFIFIGGNLLLWQAGLATAISDMENPDELSIYNMSVHDLVMSNIIDEGELCRKALRIMR